MTKVPGAVPVKSRLHAALGPERATALYRCFLLDRLDARYPRNVRLTLLRYRYLQLSGASREDRLALLRALAERHPGSARVYQQLLAEYAGAGEVAALVETVKHWLARDSSRLYLSQIRRMFDHAAASPTGAAPVERSAAKAAGSAAKAAGSAGGEASSRSLAVGAPQ